ncbi:MAG: hypothetical protein QM570_19815 [Planctomycetota bacterium]|nr:hypothetical protein [Planctomycetota bacterium]
MRGRIAAISLELKHHAPFTLFGAATGIVCMLLFHNAGQAVNHRLFLVFHPAHVVLSAIVTASLFKRYEKNTSLIKLLVIGYLGAVGVATVSDCVLPYFGETLLGVALPTHADLHHHHEGPIHDHGSAGHDDHSHEDCAVRPRLHLGFIEDWYVVNPAALLGIFIAYFWPRTTFPHAGHVLVSTWASSFHVLMNTHAELTATMLVGIFVVLFIAVWLPCCISDIVFPLLFVRSAPPHAHVHMHAHGKSEPEAAS